MKMKILEMTLQTANKATVTRFNKAFIEGNDIIAPDFINYRDTEGYYFK